MSKKFVVTESERNQIKSLYVKKNILNEQKRLTNFDGEIFEIIVGAGLREYQINGIYEDKQYKGKFIINVNQKRTGGRKGTKLFGDEETQKSLYFDCSVEEPELYGYNSKDERVKWTEKYTSDDIKALIDRFREELCNL